MASEVSSGSLSFGVKAMEKITSKREAYHEEGETIRAQIQDFAKTLGTLKSDLPEEMLKGAALKLEKILKLSLAARDEVDAFVDGCEKATPEIAEIFRDHDCVVPAIDGIIGREMDKVRKHSDFDKDAQVKKLKKNSKVLEDNDEEDFEIDETQELTEAQLKCPISQKRMEDPVKSKKCGHAYSKKSAEQYFKKLSNCAHPGCRFKMIYSDFERDAETQVLIDKFDRIAQRSTQYTQNVDDDNNMDEDD